jgi:hypothetical protein
MIEIAVDQIRQTIDGSASAHRAEPIEVRHRIHQYPQLWNREKNRAATYRPAGKPRRSRQPLGPYPGVGMVTP